MKACKLCNRDISTEADGDIYCCNGCEAVDQIISSMDLPDSELEAKKTLLLEAVFSQDTHTPETIEDKAYAQEMRMSVSGMVCPACSWIIHHSLEKQPGVLSASVNFISETVSIEFNPMKIGKDTIEATINKLGYGIREEQSSAPFFDYYGFGTGWFFAANVMMLSFVVYSADYWDIPPMMQRVSWLLMALFTFLTMYFGARATFSKGIAQLKTLDFRMETLITISSTTALAYSFYSIAMGDFKHLYFDVVCLLLMLVETGNLITTSFYARLRKRVFQLSEHLPRKVRINSEQEAYAQTEDLKPNDQFVVVQNEVVPTDGILQDSAEFDFSLINGESAGVELKEGQLVGAGARLLSPTCLLAVPSSGTSSLIQTIIESTINAFNTNNETQTTGDRISRFFVPVVISLAVISGAVFMVFSSPQRGLVTFLGVLIVACPCAFGIAEPLVLTIAVGKAKELGIQVFNGNVFSYRPTSVIFDKTGTLTASAMTVSKIHWFVDENQHDLDVLASLESGIEHPIAKVLSSLGKGLAVETKDAKVGSIAGTVDGTRYLCGQPTIFPNMDLPGEIKDIPGTLVAFGTEDVCRLVIVLTDQVRPEVPKLISFLKAEGLNLHICSGDREKAVARISEELDIPAKGGMTPSDKQDFIRQLQADGECVMMVGDGINDAQSLAAADFGLAVFSGQIPAQMSADAVFLTPSLESLSDVFRRMKTVRKRIFSNYTWAFSYNIVGISLAISGLLTPTFCAVGMVFSNFVVIINSLRTGREWD